jgi:hypothetical protein
MEGPQLRETLEVRPSERPNRVGPATVAKSENVVSLLAYDLVLLSALVPIMMNVSSF